MVAFLVAACNATGFLGGCMFGHAFGELSAENSDQILIEAKIRKAYSDGRLDAIESVADVLIQRNTPKKSLTINSPPQPTESERRDESSAPQK